MPDAATLRRALDILTEGPAAQVAPGLRAEALETREAARPWTRGPGIQGLGIAEKVTGGERLETLALKVYVVRKLPPSEVPNPVPPRVRVPGCDEPLPTDVEAIGRVQLESNTSRVRPAIPGYSLAHPKRSAGTLGCVVRRRGGGRPDLFVLSNLHVLTDDGCGDEGDPILQPAPYDGGEAGDVLGWLSARAPLDFADDGFPNLVDAAIARVPAADVTAAIRHIGVPAGVNPRVRRGMRVQKTGRTSDHTVGIVRDVDYRLSLEYRRPGGGTARAGFRDQVLCTRYTAGGDSGAAVLSTGRRVVGLHFAGSPSSSVFNKIHHVLDALDIEVVTGS